MNDLSLWIIGAGNISLEYAKVLLNLNHIFKVIGRSDQSAELFELTSGIPVFRGGISKALSIYKPPEQAIVAVGVDNLAEVTKELIKSGTRRILVEKPGGLNRSEIEKLKKLADNYKAEIFIAFNRRYYASTQMAREIIIQDGGILSCVFEFNEWSHLILPMKIPIKIKQNWFLANSSHVVDLVFHLCGKPIKWNTWFAGTLIWHPTASRFCGSGITDRNALFSYHADWQAPGRWGIEILTQKHRLILRPMEQLHVVKIGSINAEKIELNDELDKEYKPGFYLQTKAFLDKNETFLCSINEHVINCIYYNKIANYSE